MTICGQCKGSKATQGAAHPITDKSGNSVYVKHGEGVVACSQCRGNGYY